MSQPAPTEGQTAMATASATEVVTVTSEPTEAEPTLHLRLVRPENPRRVGWQSGTVDNEHLNRKKSKCCCVYRKPKPFGESSSDEEDECKACIGHRHHKPQGGGGGGPAAGGSGPTPSSGGGGGGQQSQGSG